MKRFLVCWEDEFYVGAEVVLRRVRKHKAKLDEMAPFIKSETMLGNGGFVRFLNEHWPRARSVGIPRFGVPDYLFCVADADKASQVCQGIPAAPVGDTGDWCELANQTWTDSLRRLAIEPERVFGFFLRWSRESVLIAGFDELPMLAMLANGAFSLHKQDYAAFLQSCQPNPQNVEDFVDTYRRPTRCFDGLAEALGHANLRKTDPKVEDALKQFPHSPRESLLSRLPDIVSIAEEINRLGNSP